MAKSFVKPTGGGGYVGDIKKSFKEAEKNKSIKKSNTPIKPPKMPKMKKQGTSTGFMVGGPSSQDDNAAIN